MSSVFRRWPLCSFGPQPTGCLHFEKFSLKLADLFIIKIIDPTVTINWFVFAHKDSWYGEVQLTQRSCSSVALSSVQIFSMHLDLSWCQNMSLWAGFASWHLTEECVCVGGGVCKDLSSAQTLISNPHLSCLSKQDPLYTAYVLVCFPEKLTQQSFNVAEDTCFHTLPHMRTRASLTVVKYDIYTHLWCALVVLSLPELEPCTCEQTTQDVFQSKTQWILRFNVYWHSIIKAVVTNQIWILCEVCSIHSRSLWSDPLRPWCLPLKCSSSQPEDGGTRLLSLLLSLSRLVLLSCPPSPLTY